MLSTRQAAERIGCSTSQITTMIRCGTLLAHRLKTDQNRFGYVYRISEQEADRIRNQPPTGGWRRGRKRKPLQPGQCCQRATRTNCVCTYSWTCPVHGETHVGTHD